MSTQQQQQQQQMPTVDEVREARHQGFVNNSSHIEDNRRAALAQSYQRQDANRERNVSEFVGSIRGQR